MRVLLTGGAGVIGSHVAVELIGAGHQVEIVDDLSNSVESVIGRIGQVAGVTPTFYKLDVRDEAGLTAVFEEHRPDAVIHLAGLKAVGESVAQPLRYWDVNLNTTITLLRVMAAQGCHRVVFSSSATVYGTPEELPLTETSLTGVGISNPYGRTKYANEQLLVDAAGADPGLGVTLLRYFNPVGAHPSGLLGETPQGVPNNLMPYVAQTAAGKRAKVMVFGDDYDTVDGTGVRDYIHVVDLAKGHVAAIAATNPGVHIFNLGTGQGVSVLQLIAAYSRAVGRDIPYEIVARRAGDIAECYCSPAKAKADLGWQTELTIDQACADSWRYEQGAR
ncbi:MAG: UDP-glucose 4-epimerase GalE [Propionibacteriaceae bacterium]|nr:UDP-glucose 4-epimerase GalE [Propionibacteriaceae bacterium]